MMQININYVEEVTVTPDNGRFVTVSLTVEPEDVLSDISIGQVVGHYGIEEILNYIGKDECIVHFDLGPEEEQ